MKEMRAKVDRLVLPDPVFWICFAATMLTVIAFLFVGAKGA